MRRSSTAALLLLVLLGLAGFTGYRRGWVLLELGGAATGSLIDADAQRSNSAPWPEFDANHSTQLEVGGVAAQQPIEAPDLSEESRERPTRPIQLVAQTESPTAEKTTPLSTDAEASEEPSPTVRIAKRSREEETTFDFTEIDQQIKAGQVVAAHKALSKLYWHQPELRSSVQERIDLTAKAIYFSPQPHVQEPYVVQAGDQLRKIAAKHHVPWPYLARLNRLDPKRLREGQKLKVIDGPFGAVVTLSNFELTLHHGGQYVRSYPCCIGKNHSTPVGKFKVLNKVTNPQYTDPDGKVFASNDPKNPLGAHWIDLGDSYGIHGTIEPDSIGKAESRGCVRLLNADVAEVYDLLDVASEVVIRP
jgi:LysM repeat protein